MLSAVTSMEAHLDNLPRIKEDLLSVGAGHASDVQSLCNDVAAMIFPSAITPPTEATISAVTRKLVTLVTDIESQLIGRDPQVSGVSPRTWPLLSQSGFLRQSDLIDFMLARVAEDRLEGKIASSTQQLPAQLLNHSDPNVADAAQSLLAADSMYRRARGRSYQALPPELLHQLCWRLVAAIEIDNGKRDVAVIANAKALLSGYDEARTAQASALKLSHFLGNERRDELLDPNIAGMHLFVAHIANTLEIDQDHVLQLIDIGSSAPSLIILRAVDLDPERAMALVHLFKGLSLTPRDIGLFENGFAQLEQCAAKTEVSRWAYARSQFLTFPHSGKTDI